MKRAAAVKNIENLDHFDHPSPFLKAILQNVERVVVGKSKIVEYCLIAMLSGGHALLEDVPGVGKTMLVRALAKSLGLGVKRIQFTPDLLPADILGVSIFNQKTQRFEFRSGPIMTNILLADEINRTSPKTQSALLEAMEEKNMTVDGVTHELPNPFFVMATQNPIEYEGTYPLPEAQLDRFLMKISMGYPSISDELDMLSRHEGNSPLEEIGPVTSSQELATIQQEVKTVAMDMGLRQYLVAIVNQTRAHPDIWLGVSPRGTLALFRAAQAAAYLSGRDYVIPDDLKKLIPVIFAHRILLKPEARMNGKSAEHILDLVLKQMEVPI